VERYGRINHEALLEKVNTSPSVRRQLKAWLKAGVMDGGKLFPTEEGVPQGGTISPLLANIALHGLERIIAEKFPRTEKHRSPLVVRYADDLVVFHVERHIVEGCQLLISEWLLKMGLELKPSKTRITHTLKVEEGKPGFDFLGFHLRQFPVGKTKTGTNGHGKPLGFKTIIKPSKAAIKRHVQKLRGTVRSYKHMDQKRLIRGLNPVIVGWTGYYRTGVARDELIAEVGRVTTTKNAYGAIASLLTSKGNAYGRVFEDVDGIIRFHPLIEDYVRSLRWS
jgi:RNA-directed DNA polymerase